MRTHTSKEVFSKDYLTYSNDFFSSLKTLLEFLVGNKLQRQAIKTSYNFFKNPQKQQTTEITIRSLFVSLFKNKNKNKKLLSRV